MWCGTVLTSCLNIQGIARIRMERKEDVLWEQLTITPTSFSVMGKTLHVKTSCLPQQIFLYIVSHMLTNQILVPQWYQITSHKRFYSFLILWGMSIRYA